MSEQPFEQLAWRNRFVKELRQPIEGVDCFTPFVNLNPTDNLIVLRLTEHEYTRMFSALITGADITYPDESMQIMVDFLKGIHCPPEIVPEECVTFPTYGNFISYTPVNPYIQPDEIPDGYLNQPFLINGENGNDFPGYEHFDVLVPFDAITFDLNFFEDIAGQLPTITVMVQGEGNVNIRFLTNVQGGLAVVTLDNPPNLLDILAGIVTGSENIVDLNQDLVSLPPETAKEIIFPQPITGAGIHTIYIVFLPILDDSLIPVRFGGGFRGIELCGFLPEGDMGIQQLRFEDCNLEQQNSDGSWTVVAGWENWLSCIPSGGGGGVASLVAAGYNTTLGANETTTSTTYATTIAGSHSHVFSKTKALIGLGCTIQNSAGGNNTFFRPCVMNGVTKINGANLTEASGQGTGGRELWTWDLFENIPAGNRPMQIDWHVSAGTGTIGAGADVEWVVIEFNDASELFVEDIRIVGNELQKKIAGAWITVTDSLASILASITAIANNAAAAAAAAQSTANTALTVANGAVSVNNTQNTRLNNIDIINTNQTSRIEDLEAFQVDAELDLAQIALTLNAHTQIIGVMNALGSWNENQSLDDSNGGYSLIEGTGWVSGQGWQSNTNGLVLQFNDADLAENQITHVRATIIMLGAPTGSLQWRVNGGAYASLKYGGVGGASVGYYRVPNTIGSTLQIEFLGFGSFYLRSLNWLGKGDNNPFD